MADQRSSSTTTGRPPADLERRRGRQLRSELVRSRREQEEQAIAAADDAQQEEVAPIEMGDESSETESVAPVAGRRPEQPATKPDYQPFTEKQPEVDSGAAGQAQPAEPSPDDQPKSDTVSDRIRALRQAKNATQGLEQAQAGATSLREAVQVAKAAENIAGASRAAAGAGRVVAMLNIPIGPLPLWAWLLIGLGVIVAIALVWLGLVMIAAVACEDSRVGWIPDAIKSFLAQLVVGLPCPGGTG
ncbi:MAG: hypothetical protein HY976_03530 [Candidatus Kerfeldbacteria bacterium]|nr:hypothetical protein [Candidatus Kerfeldbacteria bacterium]